MRAVPPAIAFLQYVEKSATWFYFLHHSPNKRYASVYCDEETGYDQTICYVEVQSSVNVHPASPLTIP
jgi:hypothetical protein